MAKKPAAKKTVSKPAPKKAVKPVAKKVSKPAPKAAPKKASKPAPKAAPKKASKPAPKAAPKKVPKPAPKVAPKKVAKPAPKVAPKKVAKPAPKVAPKKAAKPAPKVAPKNVVKPAVKAPAPKAVAPKPAAKSVSKPVAVKPASVIRSAEKKMDIPELILPKIKKVGPTPLKRSTVDITRTRYSDEELKEFKTLISEKLEVAKADLRQIQTNITKEDENGTADTENRFGGMEDGAGTLEREYLNQMATRLGTYIGHLEKALMRIENKTYGICRVTGKLIAKERLRAVPHATLSLEAKELQN